MRVLRDAVGYLRHSLVYGIIICTLPNLMLCIGVCVIFNLNVQWFFRFTQLPKKKRLRLLNTVSSIDSHWLYILHRAMGVLYCYVTCVRRECMYARDPNSPKPKTRIWTAMHDIYLAPPPPRLLRFC